MNIKDVANTPDKHRDTLIAIARAGDGRWPELRRKLLAAGVDEGWLYNLELDAREHHEVAREERLARPEPESMGTDPDLLRRELEKKFADYLSLVLEAPQHLDAETLLELLEEHHETFRAQREIATPAERALSGVSSVGRLFGADFFDQNNKPPRRKVLLEQRDMNEQPAPFLPLGKVGLFVSPGGVGKTTVLSQLAISVATGLPWLGFEVASPGKVFLGLGEEDKDEVHRRLHDAGNLYGLGDKDDAHNPMAPSMARAREHAAKNIHAAPLCGKIVPLLEEEEESAFMGELLEYLEVHAGEDGWRLIILDPGSRFMGIENENDNAQATRFIQACERLAQAPGQPTVIIAHHTNQPATREGAVDQTAARGASAFVDGARWVASLSPEIVPEAWMRQRRVHQAVLMRHLKSNYGPRAKEVLLLREPCGWTAAGVDETRAFIEAVKEEKAQRQAEDKERAKLAREAARASIADSESKDTESSKKNYQGADIV
ncbi:MAG: hypothetical protein CL911_07735 [Deltaproteobacteria bacterium]|nr:hypothetical protein [Deltaproteobacteria bacterium]